MTLYTLFAGLASITIVFAATRDAGKSPHLATSNTYPAVVVAPEPAGGQSAGEQLFREFGCIGCHRADGTGSGPALAGLFGRPMTDPGCGSLTADEEYVRESILNPPAMVAPGYAPAMPSFAGKVTEEELRALIAHVKSLGVR